MIKKEDIVHPDNWTVGDFEIYYDDVVTNSTYGRFFDIKENDVIVDLGANIGLYSLYASDIQPNIKKIYMVEPSFNNFESMIKNILKLRRDNLHKFIPIKLAISGEIGQSVLNSNSSTPHLGVGDEIVKTFSFMDFIDFYNIGKIDVLKVDIEGSEVDVFKDETYDYINENVDRICGEFHPIRMYGEKMVDIIRNLIKLGFDVKMYSIDGYDITNILLDNAIIQKNNKPAYDYYKQYLIFAKKKKLFK